MTKNTLCRTHLAVFVNVVLEVVVFSDDSFGDERLVVDADGGQQGGAVGLGQPGDLRGLLVVRVVQVQTSLHGHNLTVSSPEQREKCSYRYFNVSPHNYQQQYVLAEEGSFILVDLGDDEVAPVDEGDHLSL